MGTYVTDTGFVKKTLAEIQAELEAEYQSTFGEDIDLDPTGPFGQLIGLTAKREANLWDLAEEIYTSRNPNEATGTSLDNIAAENAVLRNPAVATAVQDVLLIGDEGTVVAAGKQARQTAGSLLYSLDTSVTITKASARFIELEPDAPSAGGGEVYTVTIDGTPYTYTAAPGDGKKEVIDDLVSDITGGAFPGTAQNINDTYLEVQDVDTSFNITWTSTLTQNRLGSGGNFTCDETGANPLPATTLDTIVTPVTGWDEVTNPSAGSTGAPVESDAALRIRREASLQQGNATDEAIRAALLEDVDGVTFASVASNRTMSVDGDGRPPKSFEAVVQGGTDLAVAEKIWETMPSGIEPYGNTSQNVTDSEGRTQSIDFSRPVSKYAWVDVDYTLYAEENFPTGGEDLIKQSIVDWAAENQGIGKDIIRQRLNIPIYEVPGVGDLTITIAITDTPGGTPSYGSSDIAIGAREISEWATSRITLTQV